MTKYIDFLKSKIDIAPETGLDIEIPLIKFKDGTELKPHQRDSINWAIKGGRRAIFASFGLGKTIMQLILCNEIVKVKGGKSLIVCPLGVRQEFRTDAKKKMGIDIVYVRNMAEINALPDGTICITNYERVRDGDIEPKAFTVTSLDEASVLRSYGSKTYQTFLEKFKGVPFKFVCTATPSPNKYKELIHYAGYLEVMDTGQALTRYFKRDSTKANNLTIHPHKEKEFWYWMSTWALFVTKPSDLGYSDEGYDMPEMKVIYHEVEVNHLTAGTEQDGQGKMFRDAALGLKDAAKEKRDTMPARIAKMKEILINCINPISDNENGNDQRREKSQIQRVVRKEPGVCVGKTKAEEQDGLSEKQRKICGEVEKVEVAESGKIQGFNEKTPRSEQGENDRKVSGLVCEKQKEGERECEETKAKILRNNGRNIFRYVNPAKQPMCDLQNRIPEHDEQNGTSHRPLSQHPKSSGTAMSQLQFCNRTIKGQSSDNNERVQLYSKQFIIWCDLNAEQKAIEKMLKSIGISYVSLYGNEDLNKRDMDILKWKNKEVSVFLSKPSMYGSGINMQQCHIMIFAGIGYEFNSFIQAIHRIFRFLQKEVCQAHIIYAESEGEILKALLKKWEQHNYLVEQMTNIIKEMGLSSVNVEQKLLRSLGIERKEVKGKHFEYVLNDCTIETAEMKDESVDLVHTSIPFSNHYEYTPSYNDFGHNSDNVKFFEQMDFLTPELLRVLKPGRLAVIHVKDRILFGNATGTGMPTVDPFSDMTVFHYIKHGFQYMGRITIETDVVRENNQTYRLGWTEQCKDGTKMGVGCPEYLLLFRRLPSDTSKAYADTPVTKTKEEYKRGRWQIDARAKWNSSGNRFLTSDELRNLEIDKVNRYFSEWARFNQYDFGLHVDVALQLEKQGQLPATFETLKIPARTPWVWSDVNRMITLNNNQTQKNLQNHICPLQFDIVDRVIERFSNKGDLVYDPFGGIGTVPYRAMKLDRKGKGCELNPNYFQDALSYLRAADMQVGAPTLFDALEKQLIV